MKTAARLVLLAVLACAMAAIWAPCAHGYPAYLVPPHPPQPQSSLVRTALLGSSVTAQGGWIVAHLRGTPYHVGFQNGYLTAQSANYWILVDLGKPGGTSRKAGEKIARDVVWKKIPRQYQLELEGIAAGLQAAGYAHDTLWDVVAANNWADQACYALLLHSRVAITRMEGGLLSRARKGGCSAFIATGKATTDGRPVMGHNTWSAYDQNFMYNVMFYVEPSTGHSFCYQSAGGQIWSGQDWYENSAGLMFTETTLADTTYRPSGTPIFIRAREAAQYDGSVSQVVKTLLAGNNGAYCNEWLIGDRSRQDCLPADGLRGPRSARDPQRLLRLEQLRLGKGDPRGGGLSRRPARSRQRRLRSLRALASAQGLVLRAHRCHHRKTDGSRHLRHLPQEDLP